MWCDDFVYVFIFLLQLTHNYIAMCYNNNNYYEVTKSRCSYMSWSESGWVVLHHLLWNSNHKCAVHWVIRQCMLTMELSMEFMVRQNHTNVYGGFSWCNFHHFGIKLIAVMTKSANYQKALPNGLQPWSLLQNAFHDSCRCVKVTLPMYTSRTSDLGTLIN